MDERIVTPALDVANLVVRFGGLVGLDDVTLSVEHGELVGLIGPNGAGKTTLLDAVTGFLRYDGSVSVLGARLDGARPDQRALHGVGRTFQSLDLFEDLTVRENVWVGARGASSEVTAALAAAGVTPVADQLPSTLPPSTRRFVALARALAGRPRVLLLDEVAAGLDGGERARLASCLRTVTDAGTAVLLVDHDLALVADVAERVLVLDAGRVIANGPPAAVRSDEQVLAAYLGRTR